MSEAGWRLALEHLGCGEGEGSGEGAGGGFEAAGDAGDAEVGELRLAVLGDEDVGGLDVAVQGAGAVGGLEGAGELDPDADDVPPRHRPVPAHPHRQRVVGVVGHHDVRPAGGGDAHLEDVDDVRVAGQPAHREPLAQEPFAVLGVEVGGEHLDRDGAPEGALPAPIDDAEAAPADDEGVVEPRRGEFRRDPLPRGAGGFRIEIGHGSRLSACDALGGVLTRGYRRSAGPDQCLARSPLANGQPTRRRRARLRDSTSSAGSGNGIRTSWSPRPDSSRRRRP